MKQIVFILLLIISQAANSTIYWVTPRGNDANTGLDSSSTGAWKSWHYGFNHVTPSDTLYIRGGVYESYSTSIGARINSHNMDGTRDHPTCFFAYPPDWVMGNFPVLDCQRMYGWPRYGVQITNATNLHFKGLIVKNVRQTIKADYSWNKGWIIHSDDHKYHSSGWHPNNITLENCVAHNIGGPGIVVGTTDTAYIINCDVFNICDTLTTYDPGGSGSGFAYAARKDTQDDAENSYVVVSGCRAWDCSDQGFSANGAGTAIFENCWSLNNGNNPFETNIQNKGSGWKFWYWDTDIVKNPDIVQLTMHNCIAAHNAFCGINWTSDREMPEIRAHIYNNFIYNNTYEVYNWGDKWGYNIWDEANIDTVGRWDHLYFNNVSYVNPVYRDDVRGVFSSSTNNLFNVVGTPVTVSYFISLDTNGMLGVHTRKADGSLPETNFGKPALGSPLIDAGVEVFGIPFNGSAPDIGWAESGSSTSTTTAPVYVSSMIQNATPTRLELTYSLSLANIVPAASAFTVIVNGYARSVISVSISGTKVFLTLASPVVYNDLVNFSYSRPATNPLQTLSGGQVSTMTSRPVTNNCTPPVNQPPVVTISSPGKSSTFSAPATIVIDASASDPNGTIVKVEFFNGSTKLGEITTLPYSFTWKNVPAGSYLITAAATDNLNTRTISDAVTVTVTNIISSVNELPVVSINHPENNCSITVPQTVIFDANASDPDGTISRVEFFIGDEKIGEISIPPYSLSYEIIKAGNYLITAVAIDNLNANTVSSSVKLSAYPKRSADLINLYPNPTGGQFTISLQNAPLAEENKLTITNIKGGTVYSGILLQGEEVKPFDLPYLKAGVHILTITTSNQIMYTKKFIKE